MALAFPVDIPRTRSMEQKRTTIFSSQINCTSAIFLTSSLLYLVSQHLLLEQRPPHRFPPIDQPLPDSILFLEAIRASAISGNHSSCNRRLKADTPKVAFLFLTNSDLAFSPLWYRFLRPANRSLYNVYVHADPTVPVNVPPFDAIKARFIPARRTRRGSSSLIAAERRLIARAIIDDPLNHYFALISQHCIPIHSFSFVYNFLFPHKQTAQLPKSFIEIISNDPNLPDRYTSRGESSMLPEVPFHKFRVGSQFFLLAKRHAIVVLRDRKLWRKFKLPCLNVDSCYPEEHYFPTLLSMEDPNGCSGFTLTNVNWTSSVGGHPYQYQPYEITADLIHRLRRSNSSVSFLFARKFAPDCLQPLMEIADDVVFRD